MGRNSIIWPMLEYQQQQRQLAGQGMAGDVLKNYNWGQGGQPPMPGQASQPQQQDQSQQNQPSILGQAVFGPFNQLGTALTGKPTDIGGMAQQGIQKAGFGALLPGQQKQGVSDETLGIFKQLEGSGERATSPAGAEGTYQIMPTTAQAYGLDPKRLFDPGYNKMAAQKILTDLQTRYKGDLPSMAVAYNAGPGVADKWIASGRNNAVLPGETQKYLGHLGQIQKAGLSTPGLTPVRPQVVQGMAQQVAPFAPHMTLEGIVQTIKRINPNASGQEVYAAVSSLIPIMNADANDTFKQVREQMDLMRVQQGQERVELAEENLGLRQKAEQTKEQLNQEKEDRHQAEFKEKIREFDTRDKWHSQNIDAIKEKISQAKQRSDVAMELRDIQKAQKDIQDAYKERDNEASFITDPELRDKYIKETETRIKNLQTRYQDLLKLYQALPFGPAPGGGTVVPGSTNIETIGKGAIGGRMQLDQ